MTAKVTVSLPDGLLERLDGEAAEAGVSRSELVQESLAFYLGRSAEERAVAARRAQVLEAVAGMRTMDERYAALDDRTTLDVLRDVRGDAPDHHGRGSHR